MKWTEILMMAAQARTKRKARLAARRERAVPETTYRQKTRRHGGVTLVGIPNKIAKRMGK